LEPYASVLISYQAKPSGLHDLAEASLIDGRGSIRDRLVSIAEAAHACELARLLSRESDPQPELFDLLVRFLDRVNREEAGLARTLMMELYFLAAAGYSPNLEGCARCAAAPDWTRTFYFSAREGSLKCGEHRELDEVERRPVAEPPAHERAVVLHGELRLRRDAATRAVEMAVAALIASERHGLPDRRFDDRVGPGQVDLQHVQLAEPYQRVPQRGADFPRRV